MTIKYSGLVLYWLWNIIFTQNSASENFRKLQHFAEDFNGRIRITKPRTNEFIVLQNFLENVALQISLV